MVRGWASPGSSTRRCSRRSTVLEAELLVHLDTQINSARHLLKLVLAQGAAIRERDTDAVLARLADIQSEMVRRGALEQERTGLLQRAGAALGVPATTVTLERLCALVTPGAATAAMQRSAELRGLLSEIAREHGINRALMRQELTFLSHLTRLIGQEPEAGYARPNAARSQPLPRAVRLPRARPPGLTPPPMPISSFFGMQTSLRGLLAQQRMLDTTGHNIANASTAGLLAPGGHAVGLARACSSTIASGDSRAGAQLGSGVDVQGFRRVRDQFLDAQYRAQNTNLNDWTGAGRGARLAPSSRSPSRARTASTRSCRSSGTSWSDLSKAPDDQAAKQALVQQARRADGLDPLRPLADGRRAGRARWASTTRSPAPAARSPRSPPSSPA